jgi:hypothetical protein
MIIKFRLEVWDTTVLFQILDMDEAYRCKGDNAINLFASPNIKGVLMSQSCPSLEEKRDTAKSKLYPVVYLRGFRKEHDTSVCKFQFKTWQDAVDYAERVLDLLSSWAQFEASKKVKVPADKNYHIYEF